MRNCALLCAICFGASSCYTPSPRVEGATLFQEGDSADVVLLFHHWQNIFMLRPELRDGPFRRLLDIRDLESTLKSLRGQREMAVVLIGWGYDPRDMADIVRTWRSVLEPQGFQRVVCIYGGEDEKLNGSPIIDDWTALTNASKRAEAR